MKNINCHLEVKDDTSGYQRMWLVPEVPNMVLFTIETYDDITVRLAKQLALLIQRVLVSAVTEYHVYGTLDEAHKGLDEIRSIIRNTESAYLSDFDKFHCEFLHDLVEMPDKELRDIYDIWYNED